MTKETINNTERFILTQIDKEDTGHVVYQDFIEGSAASEMINHVRDLKSEENAKKIAETLNLLYQLTDKRQCVKVVREVVDRIDLSSDKIVNSETM